MTDVIVCSAAEIDYTESLRWYTERSVDAANNFDNEFDWAIKQITANPERFPMCDGRHRFFLMRQFPFRIIYRNCGNDVVVIAVAHTSRAPRYWTDR